MPTDSAWNAYIFRDGKRIVEGSTLANELAAGLADFAKLPATERRTAIIDLLLRAGELECALQDADSAETTPSVQAITDELAASLLCGAAIRGAAIRGDGLAQHLKAIATPSTVQIAVPEGFAYYALHPLDYIDLVRRLNTGAGAMAVVGIRSIGTTLGAVVQAALRAGGNDARRISVRPSGHPYNRNCEFSEAQRQWIAERNAREAQFFVVDEGPGLSGSSFLSVGEALAAAGVPRQRIRFLCSRKPDTAGLTATDAARRWRSFQSHCIDPTKHLPSRAKHYIAGGIWRAQAFASEADWPSSWLQMERLKFLSEGGEFLFRFEGFGPFGANLHDRVRTIADAGFGPEPQPREEGFGVYRMLRGRYLSMADLTAAVLSRIAEYCAFRASDLQAEPGGPGELQNMLRFNVQQEFGAEPPEPLAKLAIERPAIADGRMLPHKWLLHDGDLLKLDAATHGDDHFFPGPSDVAWDLAGTIIEWNLNAEAAAFFLQHYRRQSGDDPSHRLPGYLLAYAIFRTAYCKMAAAAMSGSPEEARLRRDYLRYRQHVESLLGGNLTQTANRAGTAA